MISLNKLSKFNKVRKRVGRGNSSGSGNYSGKGMKGQNSRAGGGTRRGFEGGQNPLSRRLPKYRGNSPRYKAFLSVNLDQLNVFKKGEIVSPKTLKNKGVIDDNLRNYRGVKILGTGTLKTKGLKIKDCSLSKSAQKTLG